MASNRQFECGVGISRPSNRNLRCEALEDRRLLALVIVDTIDDVIDFSDGKTSLREAIFATNTVPGADEIRFNFGESLPAMILLKQGELKITDALTVFGPGSDLLTIDASGNDPTPTRDLGDGSRVFNIDDGLSISHIDVTIAGITITGGDANSKGGGISSRESLRVANVRLVDNAANDGAGAIDIVTAGPANVSLESSFIVNNRGWGSGGGILVALSSNSHLSVTDCTISGNRSSDTVADGGGMQIHTSGQVNVELSRNVISDNRTSGTGGDGGGLHLRGNGGGALSMTNNQFLRNSTNGTGAEGGGAFISWRGNATIEGNHFELNSTHGTGAEGGGLNISGGGGALSINRNQFFRNSTDGTGAQGGGLYASHSGDANLLVYENEFRENSTRGTSADGGGAAITKTGGGTALIFNNIIVGNRIQGTFPVGLGVYVAASSSGTVNFYANNVLGNIPALEQRNRGFAGIGAESFAGGRIFIEHNIVSNNFGGIWTSGVGYTAVNRNIVTGNAIAGMSLASSGAGRTEVNENIVTNNTAVGISLSATNGGAIHSRKNIVVGNGNKTIQSGGGVALGAQSGGTISFEDGVVEGNSALGGCGGISTFLRSGGSIQIRGTTVADNHSFRYLSSIDGGGVRVDNRGGVFTLEQSTITGNSSIGGGGGISLGGVNEGQFASEFIIRNSTIARNVADSDNDGTGSGGGIYIGSGALHLDHSIVALNADNSARAPDVAGNVTEASFNLIGDNATSSLFEAPVYFPDSNGNIVGGLVHGPIDPLLGPLAENGGPTRTLALLPDSPAIDAGNAALEPGIVGVPEFDQRGAPFTRLAGSRIDIGAFERQTPQGALNADFNLDGRTDGADFLAWQRGFGRTNPTIRHGDATADGDVDANDLSVWKARVEQSSDHTNLPVAISTDDVRLSAILEASAVREPTSTLAGLTLASHSPSSSRRLVRSELPDFQVCRLNLANVREFAAINTAAPIVAADVNPKATRPALINTSIAESEDSLHVALEEAFAEWGIDGR